MSFLQIQHVTKRFGSSTAVDDLSLEIQKGEFISLLGPSGCGKTTTLQMVAGFVDPTQGSINLAGRSLTRLPPQKRDIGIVFQSYALFPHMTVRQNVGFGLQMRGVGAHEASKRIDKVLALVKLDAYGDRHPKQLSGGQRQRVALARAIVIDPQLLLLDEPLSNLDAKLREEMQIELRRICSTAGVTTILVTHDQGEALALSDRIAVLRNGRLEQLGTPKDIYRTPTSEFVGDFIGKMNLWSATLEPIGASTARVVSEQSILGLCEVPPHLHAGEAVAAGVRPQAISFTSSGSERVSGNIAARIYQGDHVLYVIATPLGSLMAQVSHLDQTPIAGEGEHVFLTWPDDAVCLMRKGDQ